MTMAVALKNSAHEIRDGNAREPRVRGQEVFGGGLDRDTIFQLQLEQREHDEKYHPEISRLTMHHRLNHMALHFAKYAGRIADAIRTGDQHDIDRTLTDIFIIAVSSANILNVDLGKALISSAQMSGDAPALEAVEKNTLVQMLVAFSSASGRMAKACEAVDHLEAVPFKEEMSAAVTQLAADVLEYAEIRDVIIVDSVRARLEGVRRRKIFHSYI